MSIFYLMGFFQPQQIGKVLYNPENLHVTLLQSFSLEISKLKTFIEEAEKLIGIYPPLTFITGNHKMYGENMDIPVVEIKDLTGNTLRLHLELHDLLESLGGQYSLPNYNGLFYQPHITYGVRTEDYPPVQQLSLIEHVNGFGVDVFNIKNFNLGKKHDSS